MTLVATLGRARIRNSLRFGVKLYRAGVLPGALFQYIENNKVQPGWRQWLEYLDRQKLTREEYGLVFGGYLLTAIRTGDITNALTTYFHLSDENLLEDPHIQRKLIELGVINLPLIKTVLEQIQFEQNKWTEKENERDQRCAWGIDFPNEGYYKACMEARAKVLRIKLEVIRTILKGGG